MIDRLKAKLTGKWLDPNDAEQKAGSYIYYLSRAQYEEINKDLSVSVGDLIQVIINQKAMLAQEYPLVLWKVDRQSANSYRVSFACLREAAATCLPKGIYALVPETWMLPQIINSCTLYQVEAATPYWAYLTEDKKLHTTSIRGLMLSEQHFLDALGVAEQVKQRQVLNVAMALANRSLAMPATKLPGLLHINTGSVGSDIKVSKKWLLKFLLAPVLAYVTVISASLWWYEGHLQQQVFSKQQAATGVVEEQIKLETSLDELQRYYQEFGRLPSQATLLLQISELISGQAELQQVDIATKQIVLTGSARSATDILSLLSQQPLFREVKFERGVQSGRDKEQFVISMIYTPQRGKQ